MAVGGALAQAILHPATSVVSKSVNRDVRQSWPLLMPLRPTISQNVSILMKKVVRRRRVRRRELGSAQQVIGQQHSSSS